MTHRVTNTDLFITAAAYAYVDGQQNQQNQALAEQRNRELIVANQVAAFVAQGYSLDEADRIVRDWWTKKDAEALQARVEYRNQLSWYQRLSGDAKLLLWGAVILLVLAFGTQALIHLGLYNPNPNGF